jgi:hypothetical protein
MSKTLTATTMWITLLATAGYASAQNLLTASDSGSDTDLNNFTFSSGTAYLYSVPVLSGDAYTGITSTVGSGTNILGSTATVLAGSNTSSETTTVTMQWRNRSEAEQPGTAQSPPMPNDAAYLVSDVLDLQGLSGVFVLQMNYSPLVESRQDALIDGPNGNLYLAWLNSDGHWVNAANMSMTGGTDGLNQVSLDTATSSPADYVGDWGVDINDGTVWAVVDGLDGQFAVVPEPGTLALIGMGAVAVVPVLLRRKLKQMRRPLKAVSPSKTLATRKVSACLWAERGGDGNLPSCRLPRTAIV